MIRRALRFYDDCRHEIAAAFGILCAAVALALPGTVGPTLDAQSLPHPTCQDCGKTALASKE